MWDIGQENVRKNRRKVTKEVEKEVNPGRKMNILPRKRGERQPRFQHVVTCHGCDHLVSIQSERHNLVIVNVHFEPELTLRQLRDRLHLWAFFLVISTSVIQKDDLMSGIRHSPMAIREKLPCSTHSFHMSLRLLNLITRGGTPQLLGSSVPC